MTMDIDRIEPFEPPCELFGARTDDVHIPSGIAQRAGLAPDAPVERDRQILHDDAAALSHPWLLLSHDHSEGVCAAPRLYCLSIAPHCLGRRDRCGFDILQPARIVA